MDIIPRRRHPLPAGDPCPMGGPRRPAAPPPRLTRAAGTGVAALAALAASRCRRPEPRPAADVARRGRFSQRAIAGRCSPGRRARYAALRAPRCPPSPIRPIPVSGASHKRNSATHRRAAAWMAVRRARRAPPPVAGPARGGRGWPRVGAVAVRGAGAPHRGRSGLPGGRNPPRRRTPRAGRRVRRHRARPPRGDSCRLIAPASGPGCRSRWPGSGAESSRLGTIPPCGIIVRSREEVST